VQLGYDRLTPSVYEKAEEPSITGDLVEAIDNVLSERGERWMSVFSVHDDPPLMMVSGKENDENGLTCG